MHYFLIIEIVVALGIFYKKNILSFLFALIYIFIISLQISSLIYIHQFIPANALANIYSYNEIGYKPFYYFLISFCLLLLLCFLTRNLKNKKISLLCIILSIEFIFLDFSTTGSLRKNFLVCYRDNYENLDTKTENRLKKELLKEKIVYDSNISSYIAPKRYNVILFFIEGFSRSIISKKLTPNLYDFSKKSIDVINYYNHTATTHRGIRGALTSFYQASSKELFKVDWKLKRIKNDNLIPLTKILQDDGYHTFFINPLPLDTQFSRYLRNSVGYFNKVFGADDFNKTSSLSDKEIFNDLEKELLKVKEPFFFGFYNEGTHTGFTPPKDIVCFKNSKNWFYNVYYNFDYNFGKFLSWFNSSKLAKNTIIIVTSDHASFPDDGFKNYFKSSGYYIDNIPLFIYKDKITPSVIDVKNLNSLSLAPTICDILGIKEAPNRFLGRSIFEKGSHPPFSRISAFIEDEYFKVKNNKVIKVDPNSDPNLEKIKIYRKFGG